MIEQTTPKIMLCTPREFTPGSLKLPVYTNEINSLCTLRWIKLFIVECYSSYYSLLHLIYDDKVLTISLFINIQGIDIYERKKFNLKFRALCFIVLNNKWELRFKVSFLASNVKFWALSTTWIQNHSLNGPRPNTLWSEGWSFAIGYYTPSHKLSWIRVSWHSTGSLLALWVEFYWLDSALMQCSHHSLTSRIALQTYCISNIYIQYIKTVWIIMQVK